MTAKWDMKVVTNIELTKMLNDGWIPIGAYPINGYVHYVLRRRINEPTPIEDNDMERLRQQYDALSASLRKALIEKQVLISRLRRIGNVLKEVIEETPDDVPNFG